MLTTRRRAQVVTTFWSIAAALAVGRGFYNSLQSKRSVDLHVVYSWVAAWLWKGMNPYAPPASVYETNPWWTMQNNYTPYAIAFLSPLALIPERWVTLFWIVVNVPMAVMAVWFAFRIFNPDGPLKNALLPGLIFLTWVGVRVGLANGQFSLMMVFFGLLAVMIVDRRPIVAGILLGLCLIKPHVGLAFFGWTVITKRFRPALISIGVILIGVVIYSVRLGQNPLQAYREYVSILEAQFSGEHFAAGVFELRPLIHLLSPNFAFAEILNLILILALAGAILMVALNKTLSEKRERDLVLLQLCCLWGLMAVFHNPYDSILLLPVMFGLYRMVETSRSDVERRSATIALWVLQATMVIEVAGRWRSLSGWVGLSAYEDLGIVIAQVDRVIILGLFIFVAATSGVRRLDLRMPRRLKANHEVAV